MKKHIINNDTQAQEKYLKLIYDAIEGLPKYGVNMKDHKRSFCLVFSPEIIDGKFSGYYSNLGEIGVKFTKEYLDSNTDIFYKI